jgi:hypothetical protein
MQKDKNKHLMSHGPYQNVGTKLTLHGSVVPQWRSRRANEGIEEFTSLLSDPLILTILNGRHLEATNALRSSFTIVQPTNFDYLFQALPKGW